MLDVYHKAIYFSYLTFTMNKHDPYSSYEATLRKTLSHFYSKKQATILICLLIFRILYNRLKCFKTIFFNFYTFPRVQGTDDFNFHENVYENANLSKLDFCVRK